MMLCFIKSITVLLEMEVIDGKLTNQQMELLIHSTLISTRAVTQLQTVLPSYSLA